jgi:hypothetical protein
MVHFERNNQEQSLTKDSQLFHLKNNSNINNTINTYMIIFRFRFVMVNSINTYLSSKTSEEFLALRRRINSIHYTKSKSNL